ncbi:hypothetical protein Tco_0135024 [Tanacetum coccineum]
MINSKFTRTRINGIHYNGSWISELSMVISHIYNFHKAKFEDNSSPRPQFTSNLFKKLSELDGSLLDAPFSSDKIKNEVWDCGGGKAPGPNDFTFKFIKRYRETIRKDFIDMVKSFETDSYIPRALHVSLQEAKMKNVFQGVKVGSNPVDISNLQFAEDALIMGKWSLDNVKNLCRILRCFYMASGLKVNFSKSKFYRIGVSNTDINIFASTLCCQPSSFLCSYLGLPIRANMNKSSNWKAIIEKFHKSITSWKAKNLSIGDRLTLIKSVLGSLGTYFFSLFKASGL